jgi:EmrB/QacA subfamily drug resistance transporter
MIFAVAMTFIDQTIVAIAIPELQKDLDMSSTGVQWIINGYLLALAALFAFGGKLADIYGHKTMVTIGVVVFATASGLCGATPTGDIGEAWIIFFRIVQGAGAAIMFPAALAIVLSAFELGERGKAMAAFFGITGALTAIGPLAGGFLTEITWRAIFWVNIPVAIIALILTARANPANEKRPTPIDYRGLVLVAFGMGLAVLGLQQASNWGWESVATIGTIVAGFILIALFVRHSLSASNPLIRVRFFASRAFRVDNVVLFLLMMVFVPICFFASTYAQISLGDSASEAGLFLLVFFGGFGLASQVGGNILDKVGARPAMIAGGVIGAVGFYLWAGQLPDRNFDDQWYWLAMGGVGCGLLLSPAATDAMNRVPGAAYGEVTGITQTIRNFGSALGLAILGSLLITENRSNIESSLSGFGIPTGKADTIAASLSESGGGSASGEFTQRAGERFQEVFHAVQIDYAEATQTVAYVMAGIMVVVFLVSLTRMPGGKVDPDAPPEVTGD